TVVTDDNLWAINAQHLSATNSFSVFVQEVNSAPVLPFIEDQSVNELSLLTVTNSATDANLPANRLTYLLMNPPSGASIDTNGITVTVLEVNSAPVLPVLADLSINELTLLRVTNTAADSDLPLNTLSYSLVSPPAVASIDTNGVINSMPTESQGPGSYIITT